MNSWDLLLQIVLLLTACLIAGIVMAWLRQSPLVGFLLAGMVVGGPGSLALVRAEDQIEAIAELGVALLLFSLGLEFSWQRVRGLGSLTLLAGATQVAVTLIVAFGISLCFGFSVTASIAIGAMLCLSSTATVLRTLADRGEIDSAFGRNSIAVLLVQDMAVVPLAILIPLLSQGGTIPQILLRLLTIAAMATGVIAVLYIVLNKVVVRVLASPAVSRNRELTVVLGIIIGLGATWLAHAAGLSPALGAFIAGMFLGSSQFAVQIRGDVSTLRILLLTLFFGAVGMVADPGWMLSNLPLVLSVALLILTVKTVLVLGIFVLFRVPAGTAIATGMCISQVGEFAFVLGSEARAGHLIDEQTYSAIVSASIVTLFATPWLVGFAPRVIQWIHRFEKQAGPKQSGTSHHHPCTVLVIGFGPAGQGSVSKLVGNADRVLIMDLSPRGIEIARTFGFQGLIADATNGETYEHLDLTQTRIVVITLPSRTEALSALKLARSFIPGAAVIVRSRYQLYHREFLDAGAAVVTGDEQTVGRALSEAIQTELSPQ
jgi:CPA2 family monovalent cation:H+ antiporter-2